MIKRTNMAESDKEIIPRASNEIDPYDSNYPAALLAKSVGSSLEKADRAARLLLKPPKPLRKAFGTLSTRLTQ